MTHVTLRTQLKAGCLKKTSMKSDNGHYSYSQNALQKLLELINIVDKCFVIMNKQILYQIQFLYK